LKRKTVNPKSETNSNDLNSTQNFVDEKYSEIQILYGLIIETPLAFGVPPFGGGKLKGGS